MDSFYQKKKKYMDSYLGLNFVTVSVLDSLNNQSGFRLVISKIIKIVYI